MCIRNNRRKFSGYYRFKKGFYGLADIPTIFQEKNYRTLEYSTPAWLDDIIVVTRGDRKEHEKKLFDVLKKLEDAGYRTSERKIPILFKEYKMAWTRCRRNGNKTEQRKSESSFRIETPGISKTTKIIPRCDTIPCKIPTEAIGKNRQTPKTPIKGLDLELGETTR